MQQVLRELVLGVAFIVSNYINRGREGGREERRLVVHCGCFSSLICLSVLLILFCFDSQSRYFMVVVAILLYAWHVPPGGSAVIKIVAFHFQSLYILLVSGIRWQLLGTLFFLYFPLPPLFIFILFCFVSLVLC